MTVPAKLPRRYTYTDYLSWGEDVRGELIDGVFYDMSPAPSLRHQDVVTQLLRQTANFLDGKPCRVYAAPTDVRLARPGTRPDDDDTVVQPDLLVVCDKTKLQGGSVRGAPDWVVEVSSPGTAAKDHLVKRKAYERAGVRELWLVQPLDRLVTVYQQQAFDAETGGVFGAPQILAAEASQAVAVLPGLSIDWDAVFADL